MLVAEDRSRGFIRIYRQLLFDIKYKFVRSQDRITDAFFLVKTSYTYYRISLKSSNLLVHTIMSICTSVGGIRVYIHTNTGIGHDLLFGNRMRSDIYSMCIQDCNMVVKYT